MSEQDTFEKVKSIVVEQLGVDEKEGLNPKGLKMARPS